LLRPQVQQVLDARPQLVTIDGLADDLLGAAFRALTRESLSASAVTKSTGARPLGFTPP